MQLNARQHVGSQFNNLASSVLTLEPPSKASTPAASPEQRASGTAQRQLSLRLAHDPDSSRTAQRATSLRHNDNCSGIGTATAGWQSALMVYSHDPHVKEILCEHGLPARDAQLMNMHATMSAAA